MFVNILMTTGLSLKTLVSGLEVELFIDFPS